MQSSLHEDREEIMKEQKTDEDEELIFRVEDILTGRESLM